MRIAVGNHQSRVPIRLRWLQGLARRALQHCLARQPVHSGPLRSLPEVEVALVSDEQIAAVHQQFLAIEGPTDVITFEHGEIVVSVDTAEENAAQFGKELNEEVALYLIHGLLHLDGFNDLQPEEATEMAEVQEQILRQCL